MSSLVSGITKIFTSLGTGVATLGSAVRAVGASLFTTGAATGASTAANASSGLFSGGGILGNMINGAARILGLGPAGAAVAAPAAAATAATGTTGLGTALRHVGGAGSQSGNFGGLVTAATATGMAPAGASAATTGGGGLLGGLGTFLGSEGGAALIGGIGESLGQERKYELEEQSRQADRDFLRAKEQRITDSYHVPASALVGGTPGYANEAAFNAATGGASAAAKYGREAWKYNPSTGQIEAVRV